MTTDTSAPPDESGSPPLADPIRRFIALLEQARGLGAELIPEPTAFALATVGRDRQPSVRILLLKGVDARGFAFYTNYESRKGRELLAHPKAALCFHWQPLEVQVRVEGPVGPLSPEEADAYFATRARSSQIGAWASLQSRPIEREGDLERRVVELTRRFDGKLVARPPHWSGFRLAPEQMEFWRNRPGRLHERHLYTRMREGEGWHIERLYP
ncbi:MAG: pyridoxamine 5'-phosphate oxidase [Gemmatimonadaceae bacterium]